MRSMVIRTSPELQADDARTKLATEIQLLREYKKMDEAYALLGKAVKAYPDDTTFAYDQAMVAEKLGRIDEMERLLRQLIQQSTGLPPRLQRAGLLAGRSQYALAGGTPAYSESAGVCPRRSLYRGQLGLGGIPQRQSGRSRNVCWNKRMQAGRMQKLQPIWARCSGHWATRCRQ